MHAIYYVLTPPGVAVCLDEASSHCSDYALSEAEREKGERKSASYKNSFCSYHGAINPGKAPQGDGNTVLYATIPWSAGYEGHPWNFIPVGRTPAGRTTARTVAELEYKKKRHEGLKKLTTAKKKISKNSNRNSAPKGKSNTPSPARTSRSPTSPPKCRATVTSAHRPWQT